MSWYARRAGPVLRQRLEELRELSPDERHSLSDEVDLARLLAERSLQIYDAAVVQNQGSDDLKAAAVAGMRNALNHVSDIVAKASKVHAVSSSVVELEHIDYVLQQVVRIIEEEVAGVDKKLADTVVDRLSGIKLPEAQGAEADAEDKARMLREALADMDSTVGGDQ